MCVCMCVKVRTSRPCLFCNLPFTSITTHCKTLDQSRKMVSGDHYFWLSVSPLANVKISNSFNNRPVGGMFSLTPSLLSSVLLILPSIVQQIDRVMDGQGLAVAQRKSLPPYTPVSADSARERRPWLMPLSPAPSFSLTSSGRLGLTQKHK